MLSASIAQLGERQTEDLKVPGSIPGGGILLDFFISKKRFVIIPAPPLEDYFLNVYNLLKRYFQEKKRSLWKWNH